MSVAQAVFYVIAALTVAGALGVVLVRNAVYAGLFLVLTLAAIAGVYILLSSEFLALVQLLVYAGAVTVLLIFALMLTRVRDLPEATINGQWPVAAVTSLALLGIIGAMIAGTDWPGDAGRIATIPFETLGDALFRQWAVPFEIASLVLLIALVGAIVLARKEEEE